MKPLTYKSWALLLSKWCLVSPRSYFCNRRFYISIFPYPCFVEFAEHMILWIQCFPQWEEMSPLMWGVEGRSHTDWVSGNQSSIGLLQTFSKKHLIIILPKYFHFASSFGQCRGYNSSFLIPMWLCSLYSIFWEFPWLTNSHRQTLKRGAIGTIFIKKEFTKCKPLIFGSFWKVISSP